MTIRLTRQHRGRPYRLRLVATGAGLAAVVAAALTVSAATGSAGSEVVPVSSLADPRAATSGTGISGPDLRLPAPTGRYRVGTTSLHLSDPTRTDPMAPTPRAREIMVRLWYPATRSRQPAAAYLPPASSAFLTAQLNTATGAHHPADLLGFATNSQQDAPATGRHHPLLLFSPGFGNPGPFNTGLHEELASRGYVIAALDHTFDTTVVEFPGGRLETQIPDAADHPDLLAARVADLGLVLDRLGALAAGHNPDVARRALPRGLSAALDLSRVGAIGYSLGSPAIIETIDRDRRIDAGAALDGNPLGTARLDRPMLMLGNQSHRRIDDPDWATFYDGLRGPRLHLVIDGAEHSDLTDITVFKTTVDLNGIAEIGPIDGARSLQIQRSYLTAWIDLTLRGRPSGLLRRESPRFPEVDFQP
jgi:hypothetical protein